MDKKKEIVLLNKIKLTVKQFEDFFNETVKKITGYKFCKLSGFSQGSLSEFKAGKRKLSLEKKIELLENYYLQNRKQ